MGIIGKDKNYYTSLGASSTIAEGILQIIASAYMGRTAHWADMLDYYPRGHLHGIPGGHDAAMMYAGALLWLVFVVLMFFVWILFTGFTLFSPDDAPDHAFGWGIAFCLTMAVPLIGQWLFWAGFIGLAGDR